MIRTAIANWRGGPRAGEGSVSTSSGVIRNVIYTFGTTSVDVPCTNPCEMLAAAEASCISMMVAQELARTGVVADHIETKAELVVSESKHGWTIPSIHLKVRAFATGMDPGAFQDVVHKAKENCPVSRSLKAHIDVEATLEAPLHSMEAAAVH